MKMDRETKEWIRERIREKAEAAKAETKAALEAKENELLALVKKAEEIAKAEASKAGAELVKKFAKMGLTWVGSGVDRRTRLCNVRDSFPFGVDVDRGDFVETRIGERHEWNERECVVTKTYMNAGLQALQAKIDSIDAACSKAIVDTIVSVQHGAKQFEDLAAAIAAVKF